MKTTARSKVQRTALAAFAVAVATAGLIGGLRLVASPTITATTVAAGTDNAAPQSSTAATATTLAAGTPAPTTSATVTVTSTKATTFTLPKAGAKCPSRLLNKIVGVPATTGGTTFLKCVKTSKGLIWTKTKAPVLTTPTPTPTRVTGVGPTTTPTAAPKPTQPSSTTPDWAGYIEPQFKVGRVTSCSYDTATRTATVYFEVIAYNGNFFGGFEGETVARVGLSETRTSRQMILVYAATRADLAATRVGSQALFLAWPFNYSGSGASPLTPKVWRINIEKTFDLTTCS